MTEMTPWGWKFLGLANPVDFFFVETKIKKKDKGEFIVLDVKSSGGGIIEVMSLLDDINFDMLIGSLVQWKKITKIATDNSGFNLWHCEIPSHNSLVFSRMDHIKKLSASLHYLLRVLDSVLKSGYKVVSPYWQSVITETSDKPDSLGALGYGFKGILLQRLPRNRSGIYVTISFVYEDVDHVWLEFQGQWKESWLDRVKEISGVKGIQEIGEEGHTAGWRAFIDTTPFPHPKHLHNDVPINKHYRWFHEISFYLMRVANILSADGAQFLWRWNNNYMLFFVPESKTKKSTEKPVVLEVEEEITVVKTKNNYGKESTTRRK